MIKKKGQLGGQFEALRKQLAEEAAETGGIMRIAEREGVSDTTLRNWVKKYAPTAPPTPEPAGPQALDRLEAMVERIEKLVTRLETVAAYLQRHGTK